MPYTPITGPLPLHQTIQIFTDTPDSPEILAQVASARRIGLNVFVRPIVDTVMADVAGQAVRVGDTVAVVDADDDLPPALRVVLVTGVREVVPATKKPFMVAEYVHEGFVRTASSGEIAKITARG